MKTSLIQTRVSPDIDSIIKQAAAKLGLNTSEFIRIAATERARKELKEVIKNG